MTTGALIALAKKLGGGGGGSAVVDELTATSNGIYNAPSGVDGYNPVTVSVAPTVTPLEATHNGIYTAPSGVDGYSPVTVNVSGGGGGSGSLSDQVRFFDYDGTLVGSYSKEDFNALTAMPANPTHEGLTSQGWNWSLSEAKAQLTAVPDGILNIGQMYTTDDGKTRLYIHIDDDTPSNRLTFYVRFTSSVANNVSLDWGDGTVETKGSTTATNYSHTYATGGDYVIKLTVNSGTISFVGTSGTTGNSIYGSRATGSIYNRGRIRKAEIGNNVTSIGTYAFHQCYSLTNVTIPNTVTSIGNNAFRYCYSLTSITIPSNVTSIDASVFQSCYSITSIMIPSGVTIIENNAFQDCFSLVSVTIPSTVTSIGNSAFYQCYFLTSITIPSKVTSIGNSVFENCYSLVSITMPSNVTSIGQGAFAACYSLTSITIPSTVTSIGSSAFNSCYSLTSITIPSNVASIDAKVFTSCYSLTSITIPSNVTSIGNSAFYQCHSFTSVTIPNNVGSIESQAFANCFGIGEYHFEPTTPPTITNTNVFSGIVTDCKIYVPYSADHSVLTAYQTATNWSTYASKMVEEAS